MTRFINIGSLNIDYVYKVPHFVRAGETLAATERAVHMGGKGLNQTVAMSRAGLDVAHAGVLGADGRFLYEFLAAQSVNVDHLRIDSEAASGHTFIQVTPEAENCILYYAGTNHMITTELIDEALADFGKGDVLVVQNEVNAVPDIVTAAKARGLITVFNPAPFDDSVCHYPFECVDVLIVNQTEAAGIIGKNASDTGLMTALNERFPNQVILLTLGAEGVLYRLPGLEVEAIAGFKVNAVDTTGAGDTFVGFAMKAVADYFAHRDAARFKALLRQAVAAAALSVTQDGAVASIPTMDAVESFLSQR
jgi:ribokinase